MHNLLSKKTVTTWHIHIEGQVQGVGFRPYVFLMANKYNLDGWVNNTVDGVHVEFNTTKRSAYNFYDDLIKSAPPLARITGHQIYHTEQRHYKGFQIIHSHTVGEAKLLLTPDFAMCSDCRTELYADHNRRKDYPFITCTNCGPRYSIIQALPYDRELTAMDAFQMCSDCANEYENPLDRRYYSQTNSCPNCNIELSLFKSNEALIFQNPELIIEHVAQFWEEGKIIAIKGIGGYLLTCDATNGTAINNLRQRKHRPTKPLALMFPNKQFLEREVDISSPELSELESVAAPIVIFNLKNNNLTELQLGTIAPNLHQIGVMLPYTPLFDLLLKKLNRPIIATSGNISNSPIIFKDEKAIEELGSIANFTLTNNRKIIVPQDDSVVRYSFFKKQKIILRRSRGIAPTYINTDLKLSAKSILAMGAMLKSTFTFLHQGYTYISQYLGDLAHFDTEQNYQHTMAHFLKLFNAQPGTILCDKYKDYASTRYGETIAQTLKKPVHYIQHHIAHFGAILGEHNLLQTEEPVLGVIWDGTGLGNDGQIWGGEFFIYKNHTFNRVGHLTYFDFILGDKMPREPRISALSLCKNIPEAEELLKEKFTIAEWNIYQKILSNNNSLKSSSMGRFFDAVASLLGICDMQTFEGEAAMQLESLALIYLRKNGLDFQTSYCSKPFNGRTFPYQEILINMLEDLKKNKPNEFIAAKFHFSLVHQIEVAAQHFNVQKIAFSGGVFQNSVLVDLCHHHLGKKCELLFHRDLSPNDENISFGQLICFHIQQNLQEKTLP